MVMARVTAGIVVRIEARVERGIKVKFVVPDIGRYIYDTSLCLEAMRGGSLGQHVHDLHRTALRRWDSVRMRVRVIMSVRIRVRITGEE